MNSIKQGTLFFTQFILFIAFLIVMGFVFGTDLIQTTITLGVEYFIPCDSAKQLGLKGRVHRKK